MTQFTTSTSIGDGQPAQVKPVAHSTERARRNSVQLCGVVLSRASNFFCARFNLRSVDLVGGVFFSPDLLANLFSPAAVTGAPNEPIQPFY